MPYYSLCNWNRRVELNEKEGENNISILYANNGFHNRSEYNLFPYRKNRVTQQKYTDDSS